MSRQLTPEQERIIAISKAMQANESLKIQACAGSGKTSTLVEIAKANPNAKFLYLAFNKSIVEEAKSKFPDNVSIKTTHALAYASVVVPNKYELVAKHTFFDLKELLEINDYESFSAFNRDLNFYLNSSIKKINNPLISRLFELVRNKELAYTHSLYLKEYQLLPRTLKGLDKYDFILLDEAQDTNAVTLSIFLDNDCKKIVVGDTFQNIYGFRDTINALETFKASYTEKLTHSFRCEQDILDKACYFLNEYSPQNDIVCFVSGYKENPNEPKTKAVITRTNAGIIEFIAKDDSNGNYKLIKEPDSIFAAPLSFYHFQNGKIDEIHKDYKWITNFKDSQDFIDYANSIDDIELKRSIELVKKYGKKLFILLKIAQRMYKSQNFSCYLTNAHISKGLEWSEVMLYDDFPELYEIKKKLVEAINKKDSKEIDRQTKALQGEVNLYYVALTRAKKRVIDLTDNDKEYESPASAKMTFIS